MIIGLLLNLFLLAAVVIAVQSLNIAGVKKSDRSGAFKIVGIIGLILMLVAFFGELLHASSIVPVYIGDLTPLKDNTVPTLYVTGSIFVLISAIGSQQRVASLAQSLLFTALLAIAGVVAFFMIAFSAI